MREDIKRDIKEEAEFLIETECTIRQAARVFGISKSTMHTDMRRLKKIDFVLYMCVQRILERNFNQKHLRGGLATKAKYELRKKGN